MSDSIVFLGCGTAALQHTRTLARVAPRLARRYASRHGEKARMFCLRAGGAGWYDSYDRALADPEATIAVIATPPATHLDLVLAALASGKHVIVEKPAFLTTDECDVAAEAAAAAGRQVLVAENYFYKPLAERLRQVIASGCIGALRLVRLNALKYQRFAGWRADPVLAGGGPLFEGGIHWVSLLNNIGPELTRLEIRECGSPLTTVTTAEYEGGGSAILAYSWEVRTRPAGVQLSWLHGSRGSVTFETNGLFLRNGHGIEFPGFSDLGGRGAMFRDFLDSLARGRAPRFTLARARRDIELVRAAARARPQQPSAA